MNCSSNALLVVAKQPQPTYTKTRLCPPLTAIQAAALYEAMLKDTLNLIRQVPDVEPILAYTPASANAYFTRLAPDFTLMIQQGINLGERLDNALTHYLSRGYQRAIIMNSDGPTLPAAYLSAAFEALAGGIEVVLGPSDDGGYYLIGLTRPAPRLLREVTMSTPTVLADTLAMAKQENLSVKLLPTWYDVDDAESLARLAAELATSPTEVAPHTRTFLAANPIERPS
jgi:rSAM/selenodomain-associated transferase 1